MNPICPLHERDDGLPERAGGKALSLNRMAQAGLPVPPGFVVLPPSEADSPALTAAEQDAVREAYRRLGGGPVAVRSSALAEDAQDTSFAGQHETILDVCGEAALLEAIARCRASAASQRSTAYRHKHHLGQEAAIAVVVQRMVAAEVAGVLFTRDPLDARGERMVVEASWGLGESVVSGKVIPDRYYLRRSDGSLLEQQIGVKGLFLGSSGWTAVPAEKQQAACLTPPQLAELARLGLQVEQLFGQARDVEWAWADGQFWLLQARPLTAPDAQERQEVIAEAIRQLRAKAEPQGTVWAKYNLAEVLPAPTPMTWSVMRRFLSGRGGYGLMLRDLGFDPDPILDEQGHIDLICGRPYVNLSREPKLYFRDFPAGYRFAELKQHPEQALYPRPVPDSSRITARFLLRLPLILWRMARNYSEMGRQMRVWDEVLQRQVYPQFAAETQAAWHEDLETLSPSDLVQRFQHWSQRTLCDFARRALRPSVFAALAMANLEQALKVRLGAEQAGRAVRAALTGVRPSPETDLAGAIAAVLAGDMSREAFLERFGHRGPLEMELAEPRWREQPELLFSSSPSDIVWPRRAAEDPPAAWDRLLHQAGLTPRQAARLRQDFDLAQRYTALREASKHYLLLGYGLLRRYLVELDRRFGLHGGIFYLEAEELPALAAQRDLTGTIRQRRRQRQIALTIELPTVLFSDGLEAIGSPVTPAGATTLQGTPLSAGVAEGPAWVLDRPQPVADRRDYVLVCPSTDPAWVPLFLRAKAVVMEAGGVLSHGAIVAREFGLPAVAAIPNVHQRLRTGQRLKVDGNTGAVFVFDDSAEPGQLLGSAPLAATAPYFPGPEPRL
jgi:pyruvate,water dikinase